MRKIVASAAFALIALAAAPAALANVSLKNGNFFIGYTDIVYPGGFEPKIERVYNSKTPYKGIFGWGWGNEYEARLRVAADGSVIVHEYGGGAENRFSPASFNAAELQRTVDEIFKVAQSVGAVGGADQAAAYRKRLASDADFRNEEWDKFRAQGKLKPRELPVGAQLVSNRFSYQYVTRVKGGYVRSFDNGRNETFDEEGRLTKITDKNGNFIDLSYGKDGKLAKLVDNFNRKIFLTFNNRGLVERIQGENDKTAAYRYNDQDELVGSRDVDGNAYTYKYSADRRHNLVQVGYTDKTAMDIAYHPRELFENVKSVKDRDGTLTEYAYEPLKGATGRSAVTVVVKGSDGKPISRSAYEYHTKQKADGEQWTYKMVTDLDGERTETVYNECCGLPLSIKRGREETAFVYDAKGRVTQKTTPNEITKLSYDAKAGKVTRVERFSKVTRKQAAWSDFSYDERGNLVFAKNSEGKGVKLIYDGVGRIRSMVDQSKRRIDFKYNENSKPVEITDPALGTITVAYTNSGEIKKVDSTAGRKVALQVTSAFQNLLDIIRPAGVTLSF